MKLRDILEVKFDDEKTDDVRKDETIKAIRHCMVRIGVEKHEWLDRGFSEDEIDKIIKKYADLADEIVKETKEGLAAVNRDSMEMLEGILKHADDNDED